MKMNKKRMGELANEQIGEVEMAPEMVERWEQVREAILALGEVLVEGLGRAFEAIGPVVERFMEVCWDGYREAGMPYGESEEGMMRWLRERAEIARLRMEAERLEKYQSGMAAFRRMLKERE